MLDCRSTAIDPAPGACFIAKIHLISPGWLLPSTALQCKILAWTLYYSIISFSMITPELFCILYADYNWRQPWVCFAWQVIDSRTLYTCVKYKLWTEVTDKCAMFHIIVLAAFFIYLHREWQTHVWPCDCLCITRCRLSVCVKSAKGTTWGMKWMVFKAMILRYKAILGRGEIGSLNWYILHWKWSSWTLVMWHLIRVMSNRVRCSYIEGQTVQRKRHIIIILIIPINSHTHGQLCVAA